MNKKKDEFLIARIPKELKDRIRNKAKSMGVKISELVRTMAERFLK